MHINKTVVRLRREGIAARSGGQLSVADLAQLVLSAGLRDLKAEMRPIL